MNRDEAIKRLKIYRDYLCKMSSWFDVNEVAKPFNMAIEALEQATTDVVEIVRCRDCTWWKSIFSWNGKEHKVCVRESAEPPRKSDDYCSYGEKREK